jgi:predicted GIY-YIG superfamily endonuclease
MKTRPERDPRQTAQCVYSIPCECGRNYIGQTGELLAVRLREHTHNLKEKGILKKSKLAQHAFEEDHRVDWDKATILVIESDSRYRKCKESVHMVCLDNPISQPSLDICPICIPVIRDEIINSQKRFK